jgi:hypothetical protein
MGPVPIRNAGQRLDPAAWVIYGDAYQDPGGWLEMTGIEKGKRGSIYNIQEFISKGNASIRFSFATGGGLGQGADGYAMTILETDSLVELADIVAAGKGGGGLGYGVGGGFGDFEGNAFTVEIDTFYNSAAMGHPHTDPTTQSHVAITTDGDPGNHVAWFAKANIEDLNWHDLRIDIKKTEVQIYYDDELILTEDVPDLDFRGGYIFFSGSTGWDSNYHRADNLEILHFCQ